MAASNFTPIILYHTTTASAAPTAGNLNNGELAINITDGKLFYKDNGGTVQVIATKGTGTIGGSTTQVQYNSSGALAGSANFTFDGTTATINALNLTNALGTAYGGTALTTYTQGDLVYASAANTLAKLGIGANTYILTSTGSVPQWSAPSAITVSTATNLAGGAAGSVPYQSGASTTTFLSIGSAGQVLTSSGSAPQWSNLSSLGVTSLSFGTTGLTPATATQGAITVAGTLATTNGGTGLTSFTANGVFYASSTSAVGQSANLTFDGTTLTVNNLTDSSLTSGRVTYATTGGNLTDSANLLYSGTDLTVYGITVGRGAGAVSTNTAVGASALGNASQSGTGQTAIGNQVLKDNTSGVENTGLGYAALFLNTTGNRNTALGTYALIAGTTGSDNVAVGHASLNSQTTGASNVAVGKDSLRNNTTASNNTAVGYQAGYSNTTGTLNVALGMQALYSNQGTSNHIAIGNSALYSHTTSADGGSNIAIGQGAAYSSVSGQGLIAIGQGALYANTSGQANTAVGGYSGAVSAAMRFNTTGSYNTAVGVGSLQANTTASNNTAVGYQAGYSNTTGTTNTFIGTLAGYTNSTGRDATHIGYGAGKDSTGGYNTLVGAYAGYALTTGISNTFVGPSSAGTATAGGAMTTGSKNTILGAYNGNQGGLDIRTSDNNIVLSDGDGNPRFMARPGNGIYLYGTGTFNVNLSVPNASKNTAQNLITSANLFPTQNWGGGAILLIQSAASDAIAGGYVRTEIISVLQRFGNYSVVTLASNTIDGLGMTNWTYSYDGSYFKITQNWGNTATMSTQFNIVNITGAIMG